MISKLCSVSWYDLSNRDVSLGPAVQSPSPDGVRNGALVTDTLVTGFVVPDITAAAVMLTIVLQIF